jgi:hypothetical protein
MTTYNRATQAVIDANRCETCRAAPGNPCLDERLKPLTRNVHPGRMRCPLCYEPYSERSGTSFRHNDGQTCRLMSLTKPYPRGFTARLPKKVEGCQRGQCEYCGERKEVWNYLYPSAPPITGCLYYKICARCAIFCGEGTRWQLVGKRPLSDIVPIRPSPDEVVALKAVEALPPGRKLDARVAESLMGWSSCEPFLNGIPGNMEGWPPSGPMMQVPCYSTSMEDAWTVVEKLRKDGIHLWSLGESNLEGMGPWQADFGRHHSSDKFACGPTPELAICRAALLWAAK